MENNTQKEQEIPDAIRKTKIVAEEIDLGTTELYW